jgi:hypothetical protein
MTGEKMDLTIRIDEEKGFQDFIKLKSALDLKTYFDLIVMLYLMKKIEDEKYDIINKVEMFQNIIDGIVGENEEYHSSFLHLSKFKDLPVKIQDIYKQINEDMNQSTNFIISFIEDIDENLIKEINQDSRSFDLYKNYCVQTLMHYINY